MLRADPELGCSGWYSRVLTERGCDSGKNGSLGRNRRRLALKLGGGSPYGSCTNSLLSLCHSVCRERESLTSWFLSILHIWYSKYTHMQPHSYVPYLDIWKAFKTGRAGQHLSLTGREAEPIYSYWQRCGGYKWTTIHSFFRVFSVRFVHYPSFSFSECSDGLWHETN